MWQKLNRIDSYELEKTRIPLINAAQLISAAPRSYVKHTQESKIDWFNWEEEKSSFYTSYFGDKEKVRIALDLERFVISILGNTDHAEHLVLSGMTYPMAYGWMRIKLDLFHLDGNIYNDEASYTIEKYLIPDEEMNVTYQSVVHDLAIYFSNANYLFCQLKNELNIVGTILINPRNLNMELIIAHQEYKLSFGFSPGDKEYPEPYFFVQLPNVNERILPLLGKSIGIWNAKDWYGFVLLASEFLTHDLEMEMEKVMDFFKLNFVRLIRDY